MRKQGTFTRSSDYRWYAYLPAPRTQEKNEEWISEEILPLCESSQASDWYTHTGRTTGCLRQLYPSVYKKTFAYLARLPSGARDPFFAQLKRALQEALFIAENTQTYFEQDIHILIWMTHIKLTPPQEPVPLSTDYRLQLPLITSLLAIIAPVSTETISHTRHPQEWQQQLTVFRQMQRAILPNEDGTIPQELQSLLKYWLIQLYGKILQSTAQEVSVSPAVYVGIADQLYEIGRWAILYDLQCESHQFIPLAIAYYHKGIGDGASCQLTQRSPTSASTPHPKLIALNDRLQGLYFLASTKLKIVLLDPNPSLEDKVMKYIDLYEDLCRQLRAWRVRAYDYRCQAEHTARPTPIWPVSPIRSGIIAYLDKLKEIDSYLQALQTTSLLMQSDWFKMAESLTPGEQKCIHTINQYLAVFHDPSIEELIAATDWVHNTCWFALAPEGLESRLAFEMCARQYLLNTPPHYQLDNTYIKTDWAVGRIQILLRTSKQFILQLHPDKIPPEHLTYIPSAFIENLCKKYNALRTKAECYSHMWLASQWSMLDKAAVPPVTLLNTETAAAPSSPEKCVKALDLYSLPLHYAYLTAVQECPPLKPERHPNELPHFRYRLYPHGSDAGRLEFERARLEQEKRYQAELQSQQREERSEQMVSEEIQYYQAQIEAGQLACKTEQAKCDETIKRYIKNHMVGPFIPLTEAVCFRQQIKCSVHELKEFFPKSHREDLLHHLLTILREETLLSAIQRSFIDASDARFFKRASSIATSKQTPSNSPGSSSSH